MNMKFIKTKGIIRDKNTNEVSKHFKLKPAAILNWRKKGCPCNIIPMPGEKSNRITYRYNLHELEHWYKEYINHIKTKKRKSNGKKKTNKDRRRLLQA